MVKEIKTVQEFTDAIGDKSTGLVVIDFWAKWCGPCVRISPFYEELSKKYLDANFYKIDTDVADVADVLTACEISAMPSFCFFNGGEFVEKVVGGNPVKLEEVVAARIKPKTKSDTIDK